MNFSDIPIRTNGDEDVDASWWNSLRQAGIDLAATVGVAISETTFTIANNQSSPANITGLIGVSSTQGVLFVEYEIYRNTTGGGATKLREVGNLILMHTPGGSPAWMFSQPIILGGAEVDFSIDATTGQVQYTSSNISGTPDVSRIKFKARALTAA